MKKIVLVIFLFLLVLCLYFHEVNNEVTTEDRSYINKIIKEQSVALLEADASYDNELKFIRAVQNAVLDISPKFIGIPHNQFREPKHLYNSEAGLCYDRSRSIEKILMNSGFKTRHIALFSMKKTNSILLSLVKRGVNSHSITEVLTSRGWLVVDSNRKWVSTGKDSTPYSIQDLQDNLESNEIKWSSEIPLSIYKDKFVIVYGLYSRHGRFYPPFNPIPDIEYSEFAQNFF